MLFGLFVMVAADCCLGHCHVLNLTTLYIGGLQFILFTHPVGSVLYGLFHIIGHRWLLIVVNTLAIIVSFVNINRLMLSMETTGHSLIYWFSLFLTANVHWRALITNVPLSETHCCFSYWRYRELVRVLAWRRVLLNYTTAFLVLVTHKYVVSLYIWSCFLPRIEQVLLVGVTKSLLTTVFQIDCLFTTSAHPLLGLILLE